VTGVSAFVLAGLAVFDAGDAAVLLTAAGGFGALAFGAAQVHNQLGAAEAATRRARMTARLVRR